MKNIYWFLKKLFCSISGINLFRPGHLFMQYAHCSIPLRVVVSFSSWKDVIMPMCFIVDVDAFKRFSGIGRTSASNFPREMLAWLSDLTRKAPPNDLINTQTVFHLDRQYQRLIRQNAPPRGTRLFNFPRNGGRRRSEKKTGLAGCADHQLRGSRLRRPRGRHPI